MIRTVVAAALAGMALAGGAHAKPAQCFTTDDGNYGCNFRGLGSDGSFEISASGYPTYTLQVDRPGVAWIHADFGSGNVALPGPYLRQRKDRACWDNPDTGATLCAW